MKIFSSYIYPAIFLLAFSACSSHRGVTVESEGPMKVSVTTGGKTYTQFNQELVHRVVVSKRVLALKLGQTGPLPFELKKDFDIRGGLAGLRVVKVSTDKVSAFGPEILLGIQPEDLITAVGKDRLNGPDDLRRAYAGVEKAGRETITVQRGGLPHKILLYSE